MFALFFGLLLPVCQSFAVIGYVPEWRHEGLNFDVVCRHVTHVIFFSLEVGAPGQGALTAMERLPRPEIMKEARAAAKKYGTKLLLCIGGNGRSAGFSRMVRKKKLRSGFVASLVSFLAVYGFDGVDYNWEYPGAIPGGGYLEKDEVDKDYKGLRLLLKETKAAIPDKVVSAAYYPDGRQEEFLKNADADFLHSMTYDKVGSHHSPYDFAVDAMKQAKPYIHSKHTLGLPFYGRRIAGKNADWRTYEDLLPSVTSNDDDVSDGFAYNGVATIKKKVRLAINDGLPGVMIWELGQDCRVEPVTRDGKTHPVTCPSSNASLLLAISEVVAESAPPHTAEGEELR